MHTPLEIGSQYHATPYTTENENTRFLNSPRLHSPYASSVSPTRLNELTVKREMVSLGSLIYSLTLQMHIYIVTFCLYSLVNQLKRLWQEISLAGTTSFNWAYSGLLSIESPNIALYCIEEKTLFNG